MIDFLVDLLHRLSGREADNVRLLPAEEEDGAFAPLPLPVTPGTEPATGGSLKQSSVSVEWQSFSFSGTLTTADGRELAFSMELQYAHASMTEQSLSFSNTDGERSFAYSGTAAEITSTSFSFSLAATDTDSTRANGFGRFNLGDELAKAGSLVSGMI